MALNTLLTTIEQRTGTQLKDSRLDRIERLITELQTETSESVLMHTLDQQGLSSPLWQRIIQEITVGETYFFRNQPQFNALRDHILPNLIAQRRAQGQRYLRLWSAACATGEEPYSLAILLRELIPDWRDWSLFILATDINQAVLAAAAAGQYRAASFRGETPLHIQGRWFQPKHGLYHLDPTVRQMVSFRELNLIEAQYPSAGNYTINHDIILCRNVTIYFDNAQTCAVIQRLYGALRADGWLLVGHAEPQLHVYDAFHTRQYDGTTIYQKPGTTAPLVPRRELIEITPIPASTPPDLHQALSPVQSMPPKVSEPSCDTQVRLLDARRAADGEDWQTTIELLEQLETSERYNPLFHFVRALVLAQSNTDSALEALAQAVYCDPKFALGHYWLGELWAQRGVPHRATTYWRRADKALAGVPDHTVIPGETEMTALMLREMLAYRLGT